MRRTAAIVGVLIALVACGGSKTFTTTGLAAILPGKADTPQGLTFLPDSSGPQTLNLISKDNDQQNKLMSYGFQGAYASFYTNDAALTVLQQQSHVADPSAHVVAMLGIVFKTADGARKALALNYAKDVELGTNIKKVPVQQLGDETIAESGTQVSIPFPGFLIYWRVGNAVFGVLDAGGPTAGASLEAAQSYAAAMQARAEKA